MKKKLFTIFMIATLTFSMTACGGKDNQNSGSDTANQQTEETTDQDTEGNGDSQGVDTDSDEEIGETLPESDKKVGESEEAEEGDSYDFNLKVAKNFTMEPSLAKISYKDISKAGDKLQSNLQSGLAATASGSSYVVQFNEYETYDGEEIDKLTYVAAVEDDDTEKSVIESGVYHNSIDKNYYQYTGYTSRTIYGTSEDISDILRSIKSSYGVVLSKSKVEKALQTTWKQAEKTEDYCGVYEKKSFQGDGYIDTITVRVDAVYDEDGNMSAYVYAERERLYQ